MNRRPPQRKDPNQVVYGIHSVVEAMNSDQQIDRILIQRDVQNDQVKEISTIALQQNIPVQKVPKEKFSKFRHKNHQGVIAFISPISFASLENIIDSSFAEGKNPLILVLDQITDVRNFGAIVRSAECAGVDAILVPFKGAAQINSDAMKTSAGALNLVPICRSKNLRDSVRYLQQSGITVTACTEKATSDIYNTDFTLPTAIVMGSEETGISNDLIKISDNLCKIPMKGKIESLNVSVATAIIVFESNRQRLAT